MRSLCKHGVILGVFTWLTIASASSAEPAKTEAPKSAAAAAPAVDPFQVPKNATPQELLDFITKVLQQRPTSWDAAAANDFRKKQCQTILAAAEQILAQKSDDKQNTTAIHYKIRSLAMLDQLGDAEAGKRLAAMSAELEKAGKPDLAREVHRVMLQMQLQKAFTTNPTELPKLVEEVKKFVGEKPQPGDLDVILMTTQMLEAKGTPDVAADAYRQFGKLFSSNPDKMLASVGARMEGAARRMTLVGNPIKLEGTLVDGKPLNWADYKDKVVLVMFWATWCEPCRAELPDIVELYQAYRDRGFDVLGISCDDDREQLESFLKQVPLPWKTLFSDKQGAAGMNNSMADYYGIIGVPSLILVGKDGKVVSTNARGQELLDALEKLLGPMPQPKAENTKAKEEKTTPAAK